MSKWLRNFPTLRLSRHGVFEFFPADRIHGISFLAGCHNNAELVTGGTKVVIGLVAEGDLWEGAGVLVAALENYVFPAAVQSVRRCFFAYNI